MKQKIAEFESLLNALENVFPIPDFEWKPTETAWSKKEIFGHLIDSAVNNLQRFTEIQYAEKPYAVRPYNQDELVKANDYQNKNSQDLLRLLMALNKHIVDVMKNQTEDTLKYQILLPNKTTTDLKFLMNDYMEHFYHHLNQINQHGVNP